MEPRYHLLCLLTILLLAGCATKRTMISLKPQSEQTNWVSGKEFTRDSVFGIIVDASFDQINDPWYLFDVEITNHSNMPFMVNPANIYCIPLNANMEPLHGDTIHAIDPELRLKDIDRDIANNKVRQKNQLGLTLLAAGIDIVTGIASSSERNPLRGFHTNLLPAAIAQGQENKFEAMDLKELHETWRSTTLRKTTLEGGYSTHGMVLVPIIPNASYLQLNIPVDNDIIRINFLQTKTIVKR